MKIGIVGTGAMGSIYAGLMADAGNEVWAVDRWREHIEAIRAGGLRVEGASGDRTVRLNATTDPGDAGVCELVIVATKAMDVAKASAAAQPMVGADTLVLAIQNGLGSSAKVAAALGAERVAIGVVGGFGAAMVAPGHTHHNGWELVRLGESDGPVTERLERAATVWREAGFRVKTFDDIQQMVWEKLICNVCFSGSTTVTGLTVAEVMADADGWRVASGCAREAYDAARAKGIALGFDDLERYVRAFGETIPGARSSMAHDLMAGRRSEVDVINGAIPGAAHEVGLSAPYNEVVTALVKVMEAKLG